MPHLPASDLLDAITRNAVCDLVDAAGVPLGEAVSAHGCDSSPVRKMQACPYAGTRAGLPMNRSALQDVVQYWPFIESFIAQRIGRARVFDAWSVSMAGCLAPLYGPRPVPNAVAACHKALLGFSQCFTLCLLQQPGIADCALRDFGSGSDFYQWLEAERLLHGTEQVCAGSPQQIAQLYERFTAAAAQPAGNRGCGPAVDGSPAALAPAGDLNVVPFDQILEWSTILLAYAMHTGGLPAGGRPMAMLQLANYNPQWLPQRVAQLFPTGHATPALNHFLCGMPTGPDSALAEARKLLITAHQA